MKRLRLDPGQRLAAPSQRDQVLAQHRLQLAGMTEAELPQQRALWDSKSRVPCQN